MNNNVDLYLTILREQTGEKQLSTKSYRNIVFFLQKSPNISGNLREFTGECNLGILHPSSLLPPRSVFKPSSCEGGPGLRSFELSIYIYIYIYIHSYKHTYIHTYMHACIHTYIYIYIHGQCSSLQAYSHLFGAPPRRPELLTPGSEELDAQSSRHMCIYQSLSLYIYIYIYTFLSLYVYIYIYAYTDISLSLYVYIYIYIHMHIYIWM